MGGAGRKGGADCLSMVIIAICRRQPRLFSPDIVLTLGFAAGWFKIGVDTLTGTKVARAQRRPSV